MRFDLIQTSAQVGVRMTQNLGAQSTPHPAAARKPPPSCLVPPRLHRFDIFKDSCFDGSSFSMWETFWSLPSFVFGPQTKEIYTEYIVVLKGYELDRYHHKMGQKRGLKLTGAYTPLPATTCKLYNISPHDVGSQEKSGGSPYAAPLRGTFHSGPDQV